MAEVVAAPEVSGPRLVRNTVSYGAGSVVIALLALVMTPFFLRRLGPAPYGVWLLATTLTFANGYLGLADLGLQGAGVRLVAEARARGDVDAVNRLLSTATVVFVALGVVLGAALAGASSALTSVFGIDPTLRDAARLVFLLVGVQVALDLPGAGFLAVIEGHQRYAALRTIEVGTRVLWATAAAAVVLRGGGIVALAVSSLAVAALGLAATVALAHRVEPRLAPRPAAVTAAGVRSLVGAGGGLLVLRVSSVLYRQIDRAVVGVVLGAAAVARYEVAYKIHALAAAVLTVAPAAVMPAAAYLGVAADRDALRALYLRGTRYAVVLATAVSLAAIVHARAVVETWAGAAYGDLTGVVRVFLAYPVLASVHVVGISMLVGLGRMRRVVQLGPFGVAVNLVLSVVLAWRFGLAGVVWATVAGSLVIWVPYLRTMLAEFGVPAGQWARATIVPVLPGAVVQVALGLATAGAVRSTGSFWVVAAAVATNGAVGLATFGFVVLGREERRALLGSAR